MKTSNIVSGFLFSSLFSLMALTSGCALSIEAEVPEIEVTQKNVSFEGVPGGASLGELAMTRSFSQEHKKLEFPEGLDSEVRALGVTLTAKNGISDFKFITFLRLTMSDGQDTGKSAELINYQQDPTAPAGKTLTMVSKNPVNTLEHWKSEAAVFTMEIAGSLPEQDWTMDVSVRFAGSVKYSY